MHKSSTFRRTTSKNFSGAPDPTPTIFNKFTPMNSCDVFLYSVARPMFTLAYAYFLDPEGSLSATTVVLLLVLLGVVTRFR